MPDEVTQSLLGFPVWHVCQRVADDLTIFCGVTRRHLAIVSLAASAVIGRGWLDAFYLLVAMMAVYEPRFSVRVTNVVTGRTSNPFNVFCRVAVWVSIASVFIRLGDGELGLAVSALLSACGLAWFWCDGSEDADPPWLQTKTRELVGSLQRTPAPVTG